MASIEPYKFREKTNLQEHNDIINKVNEIVDVINDNELDTIGTRLTNDESQIAVNSAGIKANTSAIDGLSESVETIDKTLDTIGTRLTNDESQIAVNSAGIKANTSAIDGLSESVETIDKTLDTIGTRLTNDESQIAVNSAGIKANTSAIDGLSESVETIDKTLDTIKPMVTNHETDIANLKESERRLSNGVVSSYTLYRTGEGKIKAQMETVGGTLLETNTLDMIIPYQYDIVSGSTDRSFKLNITMSDESVSTSNDFTIPDSGSSSVLMYPPLVTPTLNSTFESERSFETEISINKTESEYGQADSYRVRAIIPFSTDSESPYKPISAKFFATVGYSVTTTNIIYNHSIKTTDIDNAIRSKLLNLLEDDGDYVVVLVPSNATWKWPIFLAYTLTDGNLTLVDTESTKELTTTTITTDFNLAVFDIYLGKFD